jgi:hypothetical protein
MSPAELRKRWPAIESRLQVGDILLLHKRRGPISRMIRRRTVSHWNHSALVFVPKNDLPFSGPLIVEAVNYGIEIHQLKKYTDRPDLYDIGVKRFPGLKKTTQREIVVRFILENIDVPYDYSRLFGLVIRRWLLRVGGTMGIVRASRYLVNQEAFICSTFVHKTFHDMAGEKHDLRASIAAQYEELRREALFTPGDLARDTTFRWVFNKLK